ncbi:MAG: rRNA pseudouridine synthase [Acidobacteria bacterium]|nr:MAG: rRNA pseudouridine synthase [Acidobacteriota bacterium]
MERLQKIIARAGIASRRKAETLIQEGAVTVNGQVVRELGSRADPEKDHIKVNGKLIRPERLEYYAVNKPRGVLSSVRDTEGRQVVTDLVRSSARLYPAGRLDYNSEGLIVLTNDGELARRITEGGTLPKVYEVKVKDLPDEAKLDRLRKGLTIDGVWMQASKISVLETGNNSWYQVELLEGKNRQLRRMFERIGHPVLKLRRVSIGKLKLGKLPPGAYRELTDEEVQLLKGGREA